MRALVVGASGFVGQYLVRHLLDAGDEVWAATQTATPAPPQGARHVSIDVTKPSECTELIQRIKPDTVFHLAAIAFVPEAEADFERTLRVNVAGTSNIVRACHLQSAGQNDGIGVVFVSSAEVYGAVQPGELPLYESNILRPANNYSLSKRMAELVVERYARLETIRSVIVRPFNHIGPGQDSRFVASNFAFQLARIAHGLAPVVLEVGNLEARRDFSDVRDIVRAYRLLGVRGAGVYNLGTGVARSIQALLDTLIRISGLQVTVKRDPARMRGPEVLELYASYDRAKSEVGWIPEISFERSLEDIYRYWYDRLAVDQAAGA